jgi:SAM-dependent methyltransferase
LPPTYVGLDLTTQGLADALTCQLGVGRRMLPVAPGLQYAVVDFDLLSDGHARLPFRDDTFDVICCSLVLSYLKRPQALLAELHRVLRPGGVFVASSMKPHCDLSVIHALDGRTDACVEVLGHASRAEDGGRMLVIAVADNGPGIDPALLSRVFEPFVTTKATGDGLAGKRGMGLGLAIVKRIVEGHRGAITVTSEPGRGTTFLVHLPCLP